MLQTAPNDARGRARDLPLQAARAPGLRAAIFSPGIRRIRNFEQFFGFSELIFRPDWRCTDDVDVVLVWGNKGTGDSAREFAQRYQKPVWCVEDGFFRSLHAGNDSPPLSLTLDDEGVYYDARKPSRLENALQDTLLFQQTAEISAHLTGRAAELLAFVREQGLSKYNDGKASSSLESTGRERILLIDQTFGDASIVGGLASSETFDEMLESAVLEFPRAEIVVKQHPEVFSGKKRGCFSAEKIRRSGVRILVDPVGPHELLAQVDHVMTVTSQFGFDALCAGKTVTCFGAPFYAGWGLTADRVEMSRRTQRRSIEELCAAAWLLYPSYVHPVTGEPLEAEAALEHLALQRTKYIANEGRTLALGISKWKRPYVAPFLEGPGRTPEFLKDGELATAIEKEKPSRVVHWGQRMSPAARAAVRREGVPLLCMEDGFLRSNVLGSDLTRPLSVVVDSRGIYYDATQPSDLEHLLQYHPFSDEDRARGAKLVELIRSLRVSKYNVQKDEPLALPQADRILLVVGQVDDDAAIELGTGDVGSNGALLRAVRHENPDAFIVFKPHPDVLSGNRRGAVSKETGRFANWIEKERSIAACLDVATEVHTMTSLVGFEALLRGLPVTTYGIPFYAGWGLTGDRQPCPRRTRRLTLEELVHATLNLYPIYYEHEVGCFLTAEEAAVHLAKLRDRSGFGDASPTVRRKLMRLKRYLWGLVRGA